MARFDKAVDLLQRSPLPGNLRSARDLLELAGGYLEELKQPGDGPNGDGARLDGPRRRLERAARTATLSLLSTGMLGASRELDRLVRALSRDGGDGAREVRADPWPAEASSELRAFLERFQGKALPEIFDEIESEASVE